MDLKPDNILLSSDYTVKLCDLGFCQSTTEKIYKNFGTNGYKAPEITNISRNYYGYSGVTADIFSLGVILFILHFGCPPFMKADSVLDLLFKFIQKYKIAVDK